MAETIENKKEIIRCSINLIWEATKGGVREIVFNDASCLATIFLTNGTKDTENLDTSGVVLISEEIYWKINNDLANIKGKESITIEDDPDSDRLSEVNVDAQTSENDTLNLKENQQAKENNSNDFENNEEINKLLPDSQTASTNDQFSIGNMNQPNNEHINDNRQTENIRETEESISNDQQSINVISGMLEQTNLANNSTQANDIGSIQDNDNEEDLDVSNYDSPRWSECEDCYGNKKEMCAYCGCSVCSWKGDRGHILLCDDEIDNRSAKKNKRLKSKSVKKYKAQQDISDSNDEDSQNIRKSSKKKTTNCNKKCEASSNPLEKSTSHNDSSIDDSIEDIPVVVIEEDEHFSNRQQIDETENVPVTQSDTNKESFTQLNSSRSSTSLHSVNQVEGLIDEIEDNTFDKDSQSLQLDQQNKIKSRTDIQINGDPKPIIIQNNIPNEGDDIESQIKIIWKKISNNENDFQFSRVLYIHTLCELVHISFKLTKRIKELKNSDQFFIPGFITVVDQVTGEKRQEINPEANN
ncbi:7460_t:CDS:10 [Dentiscutata heterogama]|uniref:7460_t:CDS:1 n=1 Tax=Dentiscutata heterogama TaxID=1316150 RepID=A0ACA9LFV1_9GLOM|nr:7460_t:CDS:10 [Dentiscutata heterogama]